MVKNELRNEMKTSIQTSFSNQTNEIKNMMASLLQMNTASTLGSGTLLSNTIANPKSKLKVITTRSGLVTEGPTIPNPPKSVNPEEDECVEETYTDPNHAEYTIKVPPPPPALVLMPKYQKMLKALLSNKEKLQKLANTPLNENCSTVILKKLPEKLGDPGKFLLPCGFSLPDLIPTQITLELANRAIYTPDGIARDVFFPVGKFTFLANFVIVDYESDPRVPLILGRPFLRTARALIDVHGEEMILRDRDERLTLNMKHDTASYSKHPHRESINLINIFNLSTNSLLEEFADELALILYPLDYDDNRACDIESDIREIEFLLYQGEDSDFKDLIEQSVLTHCDDLFVDPIPEMFTNEQPPDYSFPPRFDVYPNDSLEIESDADTFDDDLFDSKGEKINEAKLLIDQLDLPCDIHSEYDSFNSQDFSRDDDFPSPDNEDKDFDPPFCELLVFEEVLNSMRLLPFSSENEDKVFKPRIYTSKKVKENQEKDKLGSKPDKNEKRGEAEKSQKQLQWIEEEKLKKAEKEGLEMQTHSSFKRRKEEKKRVKFAFYRKFIVKGQFCIDSSGWSFVFKVLGQMTYLVASLTLDSANSCVMQGASCTQRKISMIVVIVAIVRVVIVVVIIGVVVFSDVSSVLKLSFLIIGDLIGLFYSNRLGVCIPQDKASSVRVPVALDDKLGYPLMIISRDEYLTHSVPRELVYFPVVVESNSDNTGGITVGEAIGACSGGIFNSLVASYACMTFIYGSSCKGEKASVAKRYLVKSFEESGEVFPDVARK
nr:reverse transcriptase domain-containing protein [Tanacetum cinerariifolium]